MELMVHLIAVFVITAALSILGYKFGMLTKDGAVAAFATGFVVGAFGTMDLFFLLVLFTVTGLVVTKIGFEKKAAKGLQEGKRGERTAKNVLGVGLPPCFIAVLYFFFGDIYSLELTIAFIGVMAVSAADTIASEIGTKDNRVWLITTFERVEPGTNGGISVLGTVSSLFASFVISLIGWLMIYHTVDIYVLIPTVAGMVGNFADSIFGTLLEDRGWISKYTNNCVTSLIGGAFGVVLYMLI